MTLFYVPVVLVVEAENSFDADCLVEKRMEETIFSNSQPKEGFGGYFLVTEAVNTRASENWLERDQEVVVSNGGIVTIKEV